MIGIPKIITPIIVSICRHTGQQATADAWFAVGPVVIIVLPNTDRLDEGSPDIGASPGKSFIRYILAWPVVPLHISERNKLEMKDVLNDT